jgi:hypothetical protein
MTDYAYEPGDRDANGETDLERARRLDDEEEARDETHVSTEPASGPEAARLRHDLSWHYDEVDRLRTVMTQAVNTLTNPRWPGDPDPQTAVLQLLTEALKPNSTVGLKAGARKA